MSHLSKKRLKCICIFIYTYDHAYYKVMNAFLIPRKKTTSCNKHVIEC